MLKINQTTHQQKERHAFRVPDATVYSSLSRASLYRAMKAGTLRSVKIGKCRLILRADLEAFLTGGIDER
jgi:excisionase family DNA binding protein